VPFLKFTHQKILNLIQILTMENKPPKLDIEELCTDAPRMVETPSSPLNFLSPGRTNSRPPIFSIPAWSSVSPSHGWTSVSPRKISPCGKSLSSPTKAWTKSLCHNSSADAEANFVESPESKVIHVAWSENCVDDADTKKFGQLPADQPRDSFGMEEFKNSLDSMILELSMSREYQKLAKLRYSGEIHTSKPYQMDQINGDMFMNELPTLLQLPDDVVEFDDDLQAPSPVRQFDSKNAWFSPQEPPQNPPLDSTQPNDSLKEVEVDVKAERDAPSTDAVGEEENSEESEEEEEEEEAVGEEPEFNISNEDAAVQVAKITSDGELFHKLWPAKKDRKSKNKKVSDGCHCKKSNCLKLYCECYASLGFCGPSCKCVECKNTDSPETKEFRDMAVYGTLKRNALAFVGGQNRQYHRGCRCKKSRCLKKYCECFQGGTGCSPYCKCANCENPVAPKGSEKAKRIAAEKTKQGPDFFQQLASAYSNLATSGGPVLGAGSPPNLDSSSSDYSPSSPYSPASVPSPIHTKTLGLQLSKKSTLSTKRKRVPSARQVAAVSWC